MVWRYHGLPNSSTAHIEEGEEEIAEPSLLGIDKRLRKLS